MSSSNSRNRSDSDSDLKRVTSGLTAVDGISAVNYTVGGRSGFRAHTDAELAGVSTISNASSLQALKLFCGFPEELEMRAPRPEERPWSPPAGWLCLYEDLFLKSKLWFPLPRLFIEYCFHHRVAFTQLCSPSVHNLVGLLVRGAEIGISVNWEIFELMSSLAVNKSNMGTYYICSKRNILSGFTSKVSNWETKYFFVKINSASVSMPSFRYFDRWNATPEKKPERKGLASSATELAEKILALEIQSWDSITSDRIHKAVDLLVNLSSSKIVIPEYQKRLSMIRPPKSSEKGAADARRRKLAGMPAPRIGGIVIKERTDSGSFSRSKVQKLVRRRGKLEEAKGSRSKAPVTRSKRPDSKTGGGLEKISHLNMDDGVLAIPITRQHQENAATSSAIVCGLSAVSEAEETIPVVRRGEKRRAREDDETPSDEASLQCPQERVSRPSSEDREALISRIHEIGGSSEKLLPIDQLERPEMYRAIVWENVQAAKRTIDLVGYYEGELRNLRVLLEEANKKSEVATKEAKAANAEGNVVVLRAQLESERKKSTELQRLLEESDGSAEEIKAELERLSDRQARFEAAVAQVKMESRAEVIKLYQAKLKKIVDHQKVKNHLMQMYAQSVGVRSTLISLRDEIGFDSVDKTLAFLESDAADLKRQIVDGGFEDLKHEDLSIAP